MTLRVLTHAACRRHAAPGHVERPERLDAALRGVAESGVAHEVVEAPALDLQLARGVHHDSLLDAVRAACREGEWLDADTYAGPASWEAALRSAGAAVEAARAAAAGTPAFALGRPPGHHATRATPMGFCLLNNVALAAHALRRRVAIVDVDVHHGNGTQDVFYARGDVLFVSLHGWPLYPGTGRVEEAGEGEGAGATLNLPLPMGTGPEGWVECFDEAVLPKVRAFRPDVVLVSAGFDADARDPLGNLALAPSTFHAAVARLRSVTPRIAAVLEGGYDLDAVREGVAEVARALAGRASAAPGAPSGGPRPWAVLAPRVLAAHPDLA